MPIVGTLMGFLLFYSQPLAPLPAPAPTLVPVLPAGRPSTPIPSEGREASLMEYSVSLTGYNAVPAQTDDDPFTTASGAYSNPEIIAARSRDFAEELPFGTIIELMPLAPEQKTCGYEAVAPEIGYRIIADVMNARYSNKIDILFATSSMYRTAKGMRNASEVLGRCSDVTIRIVGRIDGTRPDKFPKSQAALAKLVEGVSAIAAR